MKILVVDDDPDITSLYKATLEGHEGFEVETFNDPRKALSNFKPQYYSISIIDVRMPGMDGFELYNELKKLDPIIKVCFITGYEVNYRALQSIFPELDQECYISKSITMRELNNYDYDRCNCRALLNYQSRLSRDWWPVGFGNFGFILSSVSIIIKPTARFLNHFLFAGMMYQGAHILLHLLMVS
jgi:DNA-binding NtrC family response regulator